MDVISYGFAVLVFSGGLMGYIKAGKYLIASFHLCMHRL